jgi:iron complex transport system ATP-binding protein
MGDADSNKPRPARRTGATPTPPLLALANATIYRGDTRVFDRLTLRIDQGRHTAILGPNGSGKTTLLKVITRELYPVPSDETSVRLFGQEDWNVWELRAKLGLVSSDLQHDYATSATGREVVLSGFRASIGIWPHQSFSQAERRRADRLLSQLNILDLADRPYGALSTGQQRRLLLGRALVHNPGMLLLDEPTNGMDLPSSFQYLEIMRDVMRRGTTMLLATHHLHEIPEEIDRVILLKQGRVFADGSRATVLTPDTLSRLYEVPVRLVRINGCVQAFPAAPERRQPTRSRGSRPLPPTQARRS